MKTGTKIILTLLALGGAGAVAYAVYDGATNFHLYRSREEYMASEELPVGAKMVVVGYDGSHPQAPTVETLLAEMAGRFGDVHFVGVPHDVAVGAVGMTFLQDSWGGVASGSDTRAFEAAWAPDVDRDQIRADLLAAVATVSDVQEAGLSVAGPESESIPLA